MTDLAVDKVAREGNDVPLIETRQLSKRFIVSGDTLPQRLLRRKR
jgi:hypothetical protein